MPPASQSETVDPQLFQDVFNANPIGIAVESLEGQPVFVNPALCAMLGFSDEEMRGKHCVDFSPPEDAEKDWELFQQLKAGAIDHYQIEKRYFRRDGSVFWGSLSLSLLDSRPSPLVLAMVEDITDRKAAQEARFRLSAIVESSNDAIISENLDAVITSWNAAAQSIFGYTEEETVGQPITILIPPELWNEENKILARLRAGERIEHFETVRVKKTGKKVEVSMTVSPIRASTGKVVGFSKIVRDITERKLAEEALRGSEQQFRTLAEAIPQLCWMARSDGYVFWYNQRWYTYTGTTPEQMEGWGWQSVHDPQTLPSVLERWKAAISTGEPSGMIFPLRGADGVYRPFLTRVMPIKDAEGRVVRWFGTDTDITELRDAQEALRTSEERLRLALQAAHIGIFEWNIQTGVNSWTPELEAMYGLPPGGFGGTQKVFESLVHPDDRAGVIELIDRSLKSGQSVKGEWRVLWPDGSVHWIAGRWQVFMDPSGEPSRMIGVNGDVTERKRSEERLREYEKTVEGAEDMIGVIDREYRFLLANRQYLKMRNLTREQVVGHFVPEVLGKEVFETVKPKLDECFEGKVVKYEMKFSYPTVGQRHLSLSYFPIEGVNGVDRVACILRDITDRKRAEQAVAEMTRKLIQAQEQERARIGRELHDDINQRLAMLSVELERLQQNPSEFQNRVRELRKELRQISDDVQALSHDLHSSKMEYLGAVSGMKSWCMQVAERHKFDIDFRSDLSGALPLEIGLPLFRVLQESVNNAIKHSGQKRVEVQLREDSGEIHLLVRDSGVGFDVEGALSGKGLGLTSMRERVRVLNGTLTIESKPNDGTTIHVRVRVGWPSSAERLAS